ncbi:uncharacterized protein FOMMEDRAFT_148484 [Fomitiporia mediterranea MF3/22]|uniref:uncharacterized protein n=1 Tax=Fomitiporia mediterranea (strain MF3/22) TaxID=694068 RepID=UPI0004408F5E|nr:uncharacterized protein FOMMEDRAFT_148484 [Fomitiporia mediterranea MF3/22]EJD00207.1 hypothetical protein FOMMEDRAFT_148484 [Fomitiporia mediterranea MF3/22]
MSVALTDKEREQVYFLLGPYVIGAFADFLFQGVLFVQFANYFSWYRDDKKFLRLSVAILFVMTTLKTIQSFVIVWAAQVVHFADLTGAIALSYHKWWLVGNGLMVATIGIYVQSYFCYRLHAITQKMYLVILIAVILLFAYVASILTVYFTLHFDNRLLGVWYACQLSSVFVGDTLLAGTTAYALLTSKSKHGLKQTNDIIDRLVRLTWQTILPASLCAFLNLVFSQVYSGEDKLVSSGFTMALPKLYAISMMWTLNARRSIRVSRPDMIVSDNDERSGRSRRIQRDEFELGRVGTLGPIHIHTDIETTQFESGSANDTVFSITKTAGSLRRSDELPVHTYEASKDYKEHPV